VGAVCLAWAVAIEVRLVYMQVYRHADMTARAERQQLRTVTAAAKRGDIIDRNGHTLAESVDADSIYAVPTEIENPAKAVTAICGALGDCGSAERQTLLERIRRGRAFVYIRRQVDPEQAKRVAALQLEGVGFMRESRRFYPNRDLAAHLLGYVGLDNTGLAGLEATYDRLIKGQAGKVLIQTDAKRRAFSRLEQPSTAGSSLQLTIDEYLQHIAERELQAGVIANRAAGGTAVIMNPWTGEILALANAPTFNPNAYRDAKDESLRNRAIQDLYEPGSTFKIVTASAALEQSVVHPEDLIDVRGGTMRLGTRVIHDTADHGVLSFTDVIVLSSNVGAAKIALRLGAERFGLYARRFGFGRQSSPDFPSESPGILWDPSKQSDGALASMGMGYQVGVTPLQMAAAVSAIANGGNLYEPRVASAVIKDGRRVVVPHTLVRRAVEPRIAAAMTTIMEQVVERGTATMAQLPGFGVAGKTGTAAKLVNGRYSRSEYNASFVGFVPARKPIFTIVVVLDSPHGPNGYYGGPVSGPIFKRIAEAALRLYGVPATLDAPPPVIIPRRDPGLHRGEPVLTAGGGTMTPSVPPADGDAVVPDLRGLDAREALRVLARLGVSTRMVGTGFVVRQEPEAGAAIDRTLPARLWLERVPQVPESQEARR
jgi:cell division protein FtsI (penicillin-binding protein 3)